MSSSVSTSLCCSSAQVNGFGLRPQRSLLYQPTSFSSFSRRRTHDGVVKATARVDKYSKSDIIVSPSILSANFAKLGEQVKAVECAGCDWIHVDVMDGRFVPNITIGPLVVDALRPVTDLPLDVHLMIVEPDLRVPDFIKAGADIVSVHCEQSSTIHLHRTVNQIKSLGAKAGVVLNPGTPLSAIEYVLEVVDLVLIMSVNPGFGGQSFIESQVKKISDLRRMCVETKVVYEGWMVRYGRRKIGRSYIHMRYFVLEPRLLAYYKKKPQDSQVPIKTMLIDGNCRVEDRGLKTHHGHMVYVLSVYNKKEKHHRITMAAFNIQEALMWKEKIESVIDQHQESQVPNGQHYVSFEYKSGMDGGRTASSSDHESQFSTPEDEDGSRRSLMRRTTIGNGPPESVLDWTKEFDAELANQNSDNQAFSRKHWRLLQCQNGLRIFEELLEVDYLPRSCSRAMKAVGVVEATCEEVFELVMSMDGTRYEWDCSFQYGSLVEEVDGHTAVLYHRLLLDWFPMVVWPRDLCYVRYWRRNDDGSYVVLFRSREHDNCGPQPGCVRAHLESGGYNIAPLKPRNGRPRTQVQHLIQIDLKGWGVGYSPSFQQHCLLQMLNSVAGLREWFSQTDERGVHTRIPVMVNMASSSLSLSKSGRSQHQPAFSIDQTNSANRNSVLLDEDSDDDDEFQIAESEQEPETSKTETDVKKTEEEPAHKIDLSCFSGNLKRNENENARNCWRTSDGNNFKVRSKNFCDDKRKIPAGKHLMDLVAVDWFKDSKRIDHVARRKGCAAQVAAEKGLFSMVVNVQVPGSTHYSMVFYFVTKELVPGSLLQRFVDGDDEFRNSRLKLIPQVPKGSWIVRQSVGSTPCLLGKAVDCNYIRGPTYLEIDVDIGSSTVANGVLGLVIGVITSLVVEMAFLVQANTPEELPERLIGAVRVSHIELSSAIVPNLESD